MRYDARSDSNQSEIVADLRSVGFQIDSLHRVGAGVPDLLCSWRGVSAPVEVKTLNGKLTMAQKVWWAEHNGNGIIARTADEIIRHFEMLTT